MLTELMTYLQFPFVRYALIVGLLISICTALLGSVLVLRRFSFIGDGLSHIAFAAMAVASIANLTNRLLIVIPVTIICAVLLLKKGGSTLIRGDALLAIISVSALSFGYLLMNLFPVSGNISADVCTTLFGSTSILTLSRTDVYVCVIMALVVIAFFIVFYNRIFALTFDEEYARVSGVNTERINLLLAIIIAIVVVLAMNLVGSLLISALLVIPSVSAMRLFDSFHQVSIASVVFSLLASMAGMLGAILLSTPVGSTIVAADVLLFVIVCLIGGLRR